MSRDNRSIIKKYTKQSKIVAPPVQPTNHLAHVGNIHLWKQFPNVEEQGKGERATFYSESENEKNLALNKAKKAPPSGRGLIKCRKVTE